MSNATSDRVTVRTSDGDQPRQRLTPVADEGAVDASLLPRLKNTIEAVVAIASVVYALGYLCWALYSWDQNLGLPPALEGQYLVAGVIPAMLLSLLTAAMIALQRLRTRGNGISPRQRRVGRGLQVAGAIAVAIGFISGWLRADGSPMSWVIFIGVALFAASAFLSSDRVDRIFAQGMSWYLTIVLPLMVLALIHQYVTRVFQFLPSEFGGPNMAAVHIDLDKEKLAPETVKLLGADPTSASPTIRAGPVRMVTAPGDFYVVLLEGGSVSHVKLRSDSVRAITPVR